VFRSGAFVAQHLSPTDSEQVQPNGVDLTVEALFEPKQLGRIARDGTEIGDRAEREPVDDVFRLDAGGYIVRYGETIHVPENHIGFVLPRSSLLRHAASLDTAVWDAGYEGRGEGYLHITSGLEIERGARIGQFVLAAADHEGTYDGSYQGENL